MKRAMIAAAYLVLLASSPLLAQGKYADEAVEFMLKKFGKNAFAEGAESVAKRLSATAARHGDDVFKAARQIGPRALDFADEAGDFAPQAMKLVARHGDDAATFVLSKPRAMALFQRYGDDAAEAMIRSRGVAEELIESAGEPAVKAFAALTGQGARRVAMMADDLAATGRAAEVLSVIGEYGEKGCAFVWEHKGALAVSAGLAAFLRDPGPFIDGTTHLADTAAERVAEPLASAAGDIAKDAAHTTFVWLVPAGVIAALAALAGFAWTRRGRDGGTVAHAVATPPSPPPPAPAAPTPDEDQ